MIRNIDRVDSVGALIPYKSIREAGFAPYPITNEKSTTFTVNTQTVDFGNAASLNFDYNDTFSISMWIKSNTANTWAILFSKWNTDGWLLSMLGAASGGSPKGAFYVSVDQVSSVNTIYAAGTTSIDTTTWKHIVLTYDGATYQTYQAIKFYINGVSDAIILNSGANTLTGSIQTTYNAMIGNAAAATPGRQLLGRVDQVSVYDKVLSLAEIQEIYNNGKPNKVSSLSTSGNLLHWWYMGDGDTHPTIQDNFGTLDGTMTGMSGANFVSDVP